MSSCLPKSKHVKLTLACYPKSKSAVAKPNSSELQYLAYYATSRPKKLLKVGTFLRQKTLRDVYRKRQSDVMVTLDICTTLIEKCHNNINLFGADVLSILLNVLRTNDASLVERSRVCFSAFCKYHDGSALGTSDQFTSLYEDILRSYSALVRHHSTLQLSGIEAIYCACRSRALETVHQTVQIPIMLSTALDSLLPINQESIYQLRTFLEQRDAGYLLSQLGPSNGAAENRNESQEFEDKRKIALYSLDIIRSVLTTNDAVRIRRATNQILRYNSDEQSIQHIQISSTLVQFAAEWVSIDLRFHVLAACLEQLSVPAVPAAWPSGMQVHVLGVIILLLSSKASLIGLSSNDVLDNLFTYALDLIQSPQFQVLNCSPIELDDAHTGKKEINFLQDIARSIAALTTHSYYKGQTTDTVRNIMQRLPKLDTVQSPSMEFYKFFHIYATRQIVKTPRIKRGLSEAEAEINPVALIPGLCVLKENSVSRAKFISLFLEQTSIEIPGTTEEFYTDQRLLMDANRQYHGVLQQFLCQSIAQPRDFQTGLQIVRMLIQILPESETGSLISLLYRVDDACLDSHHYTVITDGLSERILLIETIAQAIRKSGQESTLLSRAKTYDNKTNLPDLKLVLAAIPSGIANNYQITHVDRTKPESGTTGLYEAPNSSSISLREARRLRQASSASQSREEVILTTNAKRVDGGFIDDLKKTLLTTNYTSCSVHHESEHGHTTIEDLFRGLEDPSASIAAQHSPRSETLPSPAPYVASQSLENTSTTVETLISDASHQEHRLGPPIA